VRFGGDRARTFVAGLRSSRSAWAGKPTTLDIPNGLRVRARASAFLMALQLTGAPS
jgi:hypothetical protein